MKIGNWLSNVKQTYRSQQKGKNGCLSISPQQFQKLKDLGLKLGDGAMCTSNDEKDGIDNYDFQMKMIQLSNFKAEHGHVCIPPEHDLFQ